MSSAIGRICALDRYDLALSKLERNIQPDRDDVKQLARSIRVKIETVKEQYEIELRRQLGNSTAVRFDAKTCGSRWRKERLEQYVVRKFWH